MQRLPNFPTLPISRHYLMLQNYSAVTIYGAGSRVGMLIEVVNFKHWSFCRESVTVSCNAPIKSQTDCYHYHRPNVCR